MTILNLVVVSIATFVLSVILGPLVISYFKKLSIRQTVREEGLESHQKKTGTPMMGGFIFLIPSILVTIISALVMDLLSLKLVMILLSTLLFGLVGFVDDYKKVIKKHNEGLTSKQKVVFQLAIGIPLAIVATSFNTSLWIPFVNINLELGWFYAIFALVTIIATTNAVNLTDGVDGLSTTVTIIVLMFYTYLTSNSELNDFIIYAVSLMGGLFGFLVFNRNPAKIFMGDIGSLALGGAVVGLALFTNTLLLIPIVGIIYFVETLSVTIQVLYFKKTGKRIFKMAPIHHHFELCGWNEKKIVRNFALVSTFGALLGVVSILNI